MVLTIFFCFILLILSLICSKNKIFSPAVITSGLWLLIMVLYLYMEHNLNPLSNKYFIALNLWVLLFSISSLFIQAFRTNEKFKVIPSILTRDILFYISIITFPFFLWKVYEITTLSISTNVMANLRIAAIGGIENVNIEDTNPFYIIIWFVSYLIELNEYSKENKNRVYILFIMYFVYAIITMAKIHFLILFLSTTYILYLKNTIKIKHIFIGIIALFFIFESIQQLRSSSDSKDKHLTNNMITLYLLSPSPAFQTITPQTSPVFGENVFRFVYAIKYKLGFSNQKPVDTFLPFINVGTGTNTYTILYPFYKDFGLIGVGVFAVFIGLIMGYIYNKAENGNILFIVIYAIFLYQIVMQYAAEMFFTNFSLNFKRVLIALLPFIMSKYELLSKNNHQKMIEIEKINE